MAGGINYILPQSFSADAVKSAGFLPTNALHAEVNMLDIFITSKYDPPTSLSLVINITTVVMVMYHVNRGQPTDRLTDHVITRPVAFLLF